MTVKKNRWGETTRGIRGPGAPGIRGTRGSRGRRDRRAVARTPRLLWIQLLGIALVAAVGAGCASYPVPLSAQAGSTIVIPLVATGAGNTVVVGFGGFSYTDHQRGTMVYQLDGPGGFELETRFSIAAEPHGASVIAGGGAAFGNPPQILSVVDIPEDAPEGTHTLHVIRRLPSGEEFPGPTYDPVIKILPHSVDTTDQSETIVGDYTPSALANCTLQCGWAHLTDDGVPRPRLRISIAGAGSQIGAFEMDVSYPDAVIDVVDALDVANKNFKPANDTGTIWIDDDGAGLAHVAAFAHPDAAGFGLNTWNVEVVFVLDNGGAQILDLAQDPVAVAVTAYDVDGSPIPGATASVVGIF